jgi:hypothetical protein
MGLVARIDDIQDARDIITALLSLVDGLFS